MKSLLAASLAILLGAGALSAVSTPASADVVGVHVGGLGIGIGVHHHHHHCWWRHGHRVCHR